MTTDLLTIDAARLRRSLLRRLAPELVEEVIAEMRQTQRKGRARVSLAESARRAALMVGRGVDDVAAQRAKKAAP